MSGKSMVRTKVEKCSRHFVQRTMFFTWVITTVRAKLWIKGMYVRSDKFS